jgi:glycosyltransferase involved in cell wall biosynthesis
MVALMDVSVIVCTRNRAGPLRSMLESACGLVAPANLAWELLVVDNGSEDDTVAIAAAFAARLPLRLAREPVIGLCRARNSGVAEARGRYICWVDDDVRLDPQWLAAYAEAFARHPDAAIFGGRILPELEPPPAGWFVRYMHEWPLANLVAYRDPGDLESPIALEGGRIPWGANYAVRAEEQKRYHYNEELGFSPRHKRTGEETDLIYRILADGGSGWWVPGACVRHVVPAERQTRDYLADYFDRAGRTAAFLHDRFPGDNANAVYGPPLFAGMSRFGLAVVAMATQFIASAAALAGLDRLSLRFLARHGFYRGVAAHRRESEAAVTRPPAPALAAAEEAG